MTVIRSCQFSAALVAAILFVGLAGCPSSSTGPDTVPVKGTLTIDGQPANNVRVTLVPTDKSLPVASGPVTNGSFELSSGVQGAAGAVPGKYKVVLAQVGSGEDAMAAMQKSDKGGPPKGGFSMGAGQEPSFPKKYLNADTSDKEVEVTSGSNNIKIEISSK